MDFDLMITSFPKLLGATVVTLKLLSASLFFGLFFGLFFAILRLNKNIFINKFAYGYSYIFRGTPLLVQILRLRQNMTFKSSEISQQSSLVDLQFLLFQYAHCILRQKML